MRSELRIRPVLLVLSTLLLALGAGLYAGPQPDDDAFITLRYARSLAEGDGFVFNPGERVLGTTTPLLTLVLAAVHRLTGADLVWIVYALALAAHGAVAVMLIRFARGAGYEHAGWLAGCVYAVTPLAFRPAVGCMETSLFVLATLCALDPAESVRATFRGTAAGVAVLLRPEGVITAALAVLQSGREGLKSAARTASLTGALVLPWVIFATWYFGSPVPQSMVAKWSYHTYVPQWLAAENFWYLLVSVPFAAPMVPLNGLPPRPFGMLIAQWVPLSVSVEMRRVLVLVGGAAVIAIALVGAVNLYRRNRNTLPLLAFAAVYTIAYCAADPHMFPWYLVPPLAILLLAFITGGATIVRAYCSLACARRANVALACAMVSVAVWQCGVLIASFPLPREAGYRRAVELLGRQIQNPAVTIGALEVGTIGYYSRARILDHYGLVSPEVLALGTAGAIERYHPEFYIGEDVFFALRGFPRIAVFTQDYTLVARIRAGIPNRPATLVYARRPSPRESGPPLAR